MGLAARRGPKGCQMLPSTLQKKKRGGGAGGRKPFLTTVHSVFLSGGAGFLSKVSLCVLTDTQELSQPRSSLALLRNRSGPGGEGREGSGAKCGEGQTEMVHFPVGGKKISYGSSTLFTVGVRVTEGAVTLESKSQHISLP